MHAGRKIVDGNLELEMHKSMIIVGKLNIEVLKQNKRVRPYEELG